MTNMIAYVSKKLQTSEQDGVITFHYKSGLHGIRVRLYSNQVAFSSGFSEKGIFEITQTASEVADSGFVKLDLQDGTWEENQDGYLSSTLASIVTGPAPPYCSAAIDSVPGIQAPLCFIEKMKSILAFLCLFFSLTSLVVAQRTKPNLNGLWLAVESRQY